MAISLYSLFGGLTFFKINWLRVLQLALTSYNL
jgi:hypothetical protein